MGVRGSLVLMVLGGSLCLSGPTWAAGPCPDVRDLVDDYLEGGTEQDLDTMLRLGPFASDGVIPRLLERAQSEDPRVAFAAYLTVGATRHATALQKLRETRVPTDRELRLARALALLALGDGAGTGTIAQALTEGTVDERRKTAAALSFMRQKRPRMLLYDALTDVDEDVRLSAAKVHYLSGSRRARRVLVATLENGSDARRREAAEALMLRRFRFRPEQLNAIPQPLRARLTVAANSRLRRSGARALRSQTLSADSMMRAAAFASLAALRAESESGMKLLRRRVKEKHGEDGEAQAIMAQALLEDQAAIDSLATFPAPMARAAIEVLSAFGGSGAPSNQVESAQAQAIARAVEAWIVQGLIEQEAQARAIEATEAIEPLAGLSLARARVLGPDGPALRAAIRVVGRNGSAPDLSQLIASVRRSDPVTTAEALYAASLICLR